MNDSLPSESSGRGRSNNHQLGRGTGIDFNRPGKLRVALHPQIYLQHEYEGTIKEASSCKKTYIQQYMLHILTLFRKNPYAVAKLFHGIATNEFKFNPEARGLNDGWSLDKGKWC